jgi:hypothetical protein
MSMTAVAVGLVGLGLYGPYARRELRAVPWRGES